MDPEVANKIQDYFGQYKLHKYKKGQILIFAGDKPEYIYNLVSGKVKQYDVTYRGDEIILNVFKPMAFFPMSIVINNTDNPYFYEAEEDIEVRQAPIKQTVEFIKSNPDIVFNLLSRVYMGTDGMLGRMAHLMSSTAQSRLIYELVIECRRFGAQNKDGSCTISVNETDLGARSGLSRETINREMRKLKEKGIIEINRNKIVIKDLAELEKKLGKEV